MLSYGESGVAIYQNEAGSTIRKSMVVKIEKGLH